MEPIGSKDSSITDNEMYSLKFLDLIYSRVGDLSVSQSVRYRPLVGARTNQGSGIAASSKLGELHKNMGR